MTAPGESAVAARRPLTGDDIADAHEQFGTCDRDGDARIRFGEFAELLMRLGSLLSAEQQRTRFDEIDSDHDGFIDMVEFIHWWRGR